MLVTTVIADDHSIMRDGLSALLLASGRFDIVAMAEDGILAINAVREHRPHLLIIDITMPRTTGVDAISAIKRINPDTAAVVLTFHDEAQYIHAALESGADAYVLKDDRRDDLFNAINSALAGKTYLSPSIAGKVVNAYLAKDGSQQPWDVLTKREREVIKLIAEGNRTKDIARHLSLSPKTIEKHRTNMMKKLDLHNVSEVTTYAIQNGLVG